MPGQAHQQPATRASSDLLHHRFPASQSDAQPVSAILGGRGGAGTAVQIRNSRVQRQKPLRPLDLAKAELTSLLTSSGSVRLLDEVVTPRLKSPADDPPPRAQVIRGSPLRHSPACRCTQCLGPHARPASARRNTWLLRCLGVAEATHPAQLRVRLQRATASGNATHEHMHFVQMPSHASSGFTMA
jgi:hypothetical protein